MYQVPRVRAPTQSTEREVSGKGYGDGMKLRRGSFKRPIVTSQLLHVIPDFVFDGQSLSSWWRSGLASCEAIYLPQEVPKQGLNLKSFVIHGFTVIHEANKVLDFLFLFFVAIRLADSFLQRAFGSDAKGTFNWVVVHFVHAYPENRPERGWDREDQPAHRSYPAIFPVVR